MQPAQTIHAPAAQKVTIACPLCGSPDYKVLYEPWRDAGDPVKLYGAASGIQGTQRIVRCKSCPMIYENPRFPQELIIEGYSSSNDAGHDTQHAMRRGSFFRALKGLARYIPAPGAKILDIGTAGGAFLEAAQEFGYEAYGLEPSRYLVERAQKRELRVEQGTIANNNFKPKTFDMVCMWDVLEHLAEPRMDLAQIYPLLKPGGILLVNYPDIGTPMAKLSGKKFWWLLSVHLTHFSRASMHEICKRTGFEVYKFKPYWQTLQFGYLQDIAIHLGVPLMKQFKAITPKFIQSLPMPYYASQTTCLAKRA